MGTFRKKPVEVEAVQYKGDNADEVDAFATDETGEKFMDLYKVGTPSEWTEVYDKVQQDWIKVHLNDWIVKGVKGEFYPVADDVFKETYEAC